MAENWADIFGGDLREAKARRQEEQDAMRETKKLNVRETKKLNEDEHARGMREAKAVAQSVARPMLDGLGELAGDKAITQVTTGADFEGYHVRRFVGGGRGRPFEAEVTIRVDGAELAISLRVKHSAMRGECELLTKGDGRFPNHDASQEVKKWLHGRIKSFIDKHVEFIEEM